MPSVGLPRISITIQLEHPRARLASFVGNWHALRMTSGFGWGRFFLIICLGSVGVCLPPGQMLGAEQLAETRLVYLELSGEPAADVAVRTAAPAVVLFRRALIAAPAPLSAPAAEESYTPPSYSPPPTAARPDIGADARAGVSNNGVDFVDYDGAYEAAGADHAVVAWFWAAVATYDDDRRRRLLQSCVRRQLGVGL